MPLFSGAVPVLTGGGCGGGARNPEGSAPVSRHWHSHDKRTLTETGNYLEEIKNNTNVVTANTVVHFHSEDMNSWY